MWFKVHPSAPIPHFSKEHALTLYDGKYYKHGQLFTGEYHGEYYHHGVHKGKYKPELAAAKHVPGVDELQKPKPLAKDANGKWVLHGKPFTGVSAGNYFHYGVYKGKFDPLKLEASSSDKMGTKAISHPKSKPCNVVITAQDFVRLQKGAPPTCMEDRWDVTFKAPDTKSGRGSVSVCRTWTGEECLRGEFVLGQAVWLLKPAILHVATFDKFVWEADLFAENGFFDKKNPTDEFIEFLNALVKTKLRK